MTWRPLFRMLAVCMAVVTFASARPVRADPLVELQIATQAPTGSTPRSVFDQSAIEVTKQTAGRVRVKYLYGGLPSDERDSVRKIKLSQLDGAELTTIGLAMIDESIRVLDLPRIFESAEELDYVADKLWPYFQKKFEKKGFRLANRTEVGGIYFFSKAKVETVADLRAEKLWQSGDDPLVRAEFKKLGLNVVPLGLPEVDAALATGKIDACYGTPLTALALGWSTKVRNIASMPMSFSIGATVLAMDAYKKLSAADAKTFESIARASSKNMREVLRKANEDAKATMSGKGVSVIPTPVATVDDFSKQSSEVWNELVGKVYSKEDLKLVLEARAEYRAKHRTTR